MCHYCGLPERDCDCAGEYALGVQSTALAIEDVLDRLAALTAENRRARYDQAMVERALREAGYAYPVLS